jgi:hypothetical protein
LKRKYERNERDSKKTEIIANKINKHVEKRKEVFVTCTYLQQCSQQFFVLQVEKIQRMKEQQEDLLFVELQKDIQEIFSQVPWNYVNGFT